jgi:hypothetical protein
LLYVTQTSKGYVDYLHADEAVLAFCKAVSTAAADALLFLLFLPLLLCGVAALAACCALAGWTAPRLPPYGHSHNSPA